MTPSPGIANFRFESPAVGSVIYEFRRIVLARWGYQLETDTKNVPLPPFTKFFNAHRGTANQVHGESKCYRQKTGAVRQSLRTSDGPVEISNAVGQRSEETSGATEEVERMVGAKHRYVDASGRVRDRQVSVKIDFPVVKGVRQGHRVGMKRRDDVSARGKILRAYPASMKKTEKQNDAPHPHTRSAQKESHGTRTIPPLTINLLRTQRSAPSRLEVFKTIIRKIHAIADWQS